MTVKLALLKSGEDVISNIHEMVVGEENSSDDPKRVVGYFFENPCVVKLLASESELKTPCKLQLTPWMPLTNEKKIPVAPDWVITIVEPMPQLKKMYEEGVLKDGKDDQSTSTDNDPAASD